ncbi:hypothetical protein [Fusibacter sp. JL216-2]|uniref:hypothetical protein n=1 Tax=Fusibacter sp. JL216-2 TaxID=3071453 RepID=UPI003D33EC90
MDRFKKNPEPFLRRSAKLSPSTELDTFKNYRAKTGHDSKYGKARLQAKITDLNTEVEIGQTESEQKPIVVMSARADKRFTHTLRPNIVDMNRAYKRRFSGRVHYNDLDQESVLPETDIQENAFKYKRHLKRSSKNDSKKTEAYDMPVPFMDDEEDKEALMNLSDRLMENRADATQHRGRDPTDAAGHSEEKAELEKQIDFHRRINHLKEEKQKMYFKQFARAWESLKRNGHKKDAIFPVSSLDNGNDGQEQSQSPSADNTKASTEGVNAFDSG